MSIYDDSKNANKGISPYETRLNPDPEPPVPSEKEIKDKVKKDLKEKREAEDKKALPEPAKETPEEKKSK